MVYRERPTAVPGVVLWRREVTPGAELGWILPDGCLDLLWDGQALLVAGPDSVARRHHSPAGTAYVALRCAGGTGPALLGVPADRLRDQSPELGELWPAAAARALTEQVAHGGAYALQRWVTQRAAERPVAALGPAVLAMAAAGLPVAGMAARAGLTARQLHRSCLPLFGYGPRRLGRVLRLGRTVAAAGAGRPLAQLAADLGYADQAHLCREVRALTGRTPSQLLTELGAR